MTKRNVMHDAVRYALFASTGALALNMGVVSAQEDNAEADVEEILVTGSRISRNTLNTISQETIVISARGAALQRCIRLLKEIIRLLSCSIRAAPTAGES